MKRKKDDDKIFDPQVVMLSNYGAWLLKNYRYNSNFSEAINMLMDNAEYVSGTLRGEEISSELFELNVADALMHVAYRFYNEWQESVESK